MEHHEQRELGSVESEEPLAGKHVHLHTLLLEVLPQLRYVLLWGERKPH